MKTVSSEKLRTALHRIAMNIYGDTCAQVIAGEALDAVDIEETAQPDTAMFNAMLIEASRIDGAMPVQQDIEALQARIAELESQLAAEWLPVSQEPTEYGGYLIVQPGGDVACCAYFGHPYGHFGTAWYSNGGSDAGIIIQPTHWRALPPSPNKKAQLAAQAGQEKTYPACSGNNCGATDGKSHSQECFAEHDACVSTGSNLLDTAGNRSPEYRYAGYSGAPCGKSASEDQRKAWKEGCDAALRPPASPARAGQEPYGWLLRIKPSSLFAFVIGPNNPWKENAGAIPLYASPSNSRAIAQSALEAAAQVCDSVNNHDNPMTASDCADAIRAIDPQIILDGMTK